MKTLILLEHEHQRIANTTYPVFTAAQSFSSSYDVLVVGHQVAAVAKQAARCAGVDTVLVADHPAYEHRLAENTAQLIAAIAPDYEVILASATSLTKDILPRVAALLDVSMHSEVIKIIATDTFVRPIYAGNAFATVQALDSIKLLSIRASAFAPMNVLGETATLKNLSQVEQPTLSTFMSRQLTPLTRPALTSARIVISGGRGLKSAENFKLIEQIADCLGAAVGASRAAVDAGFAPNDYQVGQTGKVVAPDLYIAVGISGAVQHLAGMKDSKVIVAINNDPDAPIFELADYSLVGDLFVILPELHQVLSSECAQI